MQRKKTEGRTCCWFPQQRSMQMRSHMAGRQGIGRARPPLARRSVQHNRRWPRAPLRLNSMAAAGTPPHRAARQRPPPPPAPPGSLAAAPPPPPVAAGSSARTSRSWRPAGTPCGSGCTRSHCRCRQRRPARSRPPSPTRGRQSTRRRWSFGTPHTQCSCTSPRSRAVWRPPRPPRHHYQPLAQARGAPRQGRPRRRCGARTDVAVAARRGVLVLPNLGRHRRRDVIVHANGRWHSGGGGSGGGRGDGGGDGGGDDGDGAGWGRRRSGNPRDIRRVAGSFDGPAGVNAAGAAATATEITASHNRLADVVGGDGTCGGGRGDGNGGRGGGRHGSG